MSNRLFPLCVFPRGRAGFTATVIHNKCTICILHIRAATLSSIFTKLLFIRANSGKSQVTLIQLKRVQCVCTTISSPFDICLHLLNKNIAELHGAFVVRHSSIPEIITNCEHDSKFTAPQSARIYAINKCGLTFSSPVRGLSSIESARINIIGGLLFLTKVRMAKNAHKATGERLKNLNRPSCAILINYVFR